MHATPGPEYLLSGIKDDEGGDISAAPSVELLSQLIAMLISEIYFAVRVTLGRLPSNESVIT
uniref:Uncharacterized protein n=1 Tax=uncultured Muribaculaceae bacterium TaxID=2301481 RepID=A0A6G8F3G8_9BACT|nr:hypothetical protein Muribac1_0480 [uncultured Muribaculaceae bacterium]